MLSLLTLFAVIFSLNLQLCSSFTQTGYYILDLETATLTTTEINLWSLSASMTSTKTYTTASWNSMAPKVILGGPNILGISGSSAANRFFSRTYSGISSHTYVSFTVVMWYFDNWSSRNYLPSLKFQFDSYTLSGPNLIYANDFTSSEGGNSAENDLGYDHIMGGTPHTGSTMLFKITHLLTDSVDSRRFGFREISFTFSSYSGPVPPLCHRSEEVDLYGPATGLAYSQCSCPIGQAMDEAGVSCVNCAAGCKKCFGPFASQCFQCNAGLLWTGSQCCDPKCSVCSGITSDECTACNLPYNNYLNGTCKGTCPSPFKGTTVSSQNFCNRPCPTGQYYYSFNQTCLTSCPNPLSSYTDPVDFILYCFNPCDPTTQFTFTNGTCFSSCPPLLSTRSESGIRYCFNPCPLPSTNYIFTSNGTCLTSCPIPLSIYEEPGIKYCSNPCPDPVNQFLFPNASCFSTCPIPLASRTEPGVKYCFNPCTSPTTDYLYPNSTCSSQCLFPLVSRSEPDALYCFNPCSSYNLFLFLNQSCLTDCPTPLQINAESVAKFCYNPCPDPVNQFLFPNQSCFANCPLPLMERHEPDVKYCFNPCILTDFLFVNQTCANTCPLPLTPRTEPGVQYCFNPCTSPTTQYLYPNGTCSLSCILPLAIRTDTDAVYCYNPCGTTTLFLYTNQSCFSDCFAPLASRTEPGVKYCFNPCLDPINDFLFPNRTCFSTCPYPLASRQEPNVKYCFNPCPSPSTNFLYWNQTCSSNCLLPLVPKFEPGVNYCINPCANPTTQLLYPNGTCFTNCPSPLKQRSEPGVRYCFNPCQYPGEFLYTNETCQNYCPAPFRSRREPDVDYCFSPCAAPNIYWYVNFTCHPVCHYPYQKILYSGVQQCLSPCQNATDYFYKNEGTCELTCEAPFKFYMADKVRVCYSEFDFDFATINEAKKKFQLIKSLGNAASVLVKFPALFQTSNPYSAFLGSYSAMAQYIRYMSVNYPDRVAAIFVVSSYIPVYTSFSFKLPVYFRDNLMNYTLPENFDKYKIPSNFIRNTWGLIESLLITVLIIVIIFFLLKKSKTSFTPRILLEKVQQVMHWNMPLLMLTSASTDIFFYGILHLRTTKLNSFLGALTLIAALTLIFYIIWVLSCVFRIVWAIRKARKNPSSETALDQEYQVQQKWKRYGLLYKNLNEKSLLKLAYIGIFILRGIFFALIITCLYNFPLAQAVLILVLNTLMMIYIVFCKPLKRTFHRVQVLTNEILLMVLTVCVLSLAIFDQNKIESFQTRNNLGEAIIAMIIAINSFAIASLSVNLLLDLYALYKKVKILRTKLYFKGVEKSRISLLPYVIFEDLQTDKAFRELINRPELDADPSKRKRIFKPSRRGPITAAQFHVGPINMPPETYVTNPMTTTEDLTPELPSQFLTLSRGGSENAGILETENYYKSPDSSGALKSPEDSHDFTTNASRFTEDQSPPPKKASNSIFSLFKRLRGKSSQPADPKPKDKKTKIKKPGKKQAHSPPPPNYQLDLSQTEPISLPSEPSSRLAGIQLRIPQSVHNKSTMQQSQFSQFREMNRSISPPVQFPGQKNDISPIESRPISRQSQDSQLTNEWLYTAQSQIPKPTTQFSEHRNVISPIESRPISRESQLSQFSNQLPRLITQPSHFSEYRAETEPSESRPVSRQSEFFQLSGLNSKLQTAQSQIPKLKTQPSHFSEYRAETEPSESRPISRQSEFFQFSGLNSKLQTAQSQMPKLKTQPSQFPEYRAETSPNESRPISRQSGFSQLSGLSQIESRNTIEVGNRGGKASPYFEVEQSVVSGGLSQESEVSAQTRNTLIRDFRRLRERQNKTKKEQKKNWYDNVRKSKDSNE